MKERYTSIKDDSRAGKAHNKRKETAPLFHTPIQPKYGDDKIKSCRLLTTLKALFSLGAVHRHLVTTKAGTSALLSCPLFLKGSQKQGFQKPDQPHRVIARLYIWEWSERERDVMKSYL